MADRRRLFISYSHEDARWLTEIKAQLAVLETEGLLAVCDDTQLEAGDDWYQRLHEMMLSARLSLLLVSESFLTSKFVREEEVPRLFARHAEDGMRIYPLLVRPCPWKHVEWLARLQLRPQDARRQPKPVAAYAGVARAQVLADVTDEIAALIKRDPA